MTLALSYSCTLFLAILVPLATCQNIYDDCSLVKAGINYGPMKAFYDFFPVTKRSISINLKNDVGQYIRGLEVYGCVRTGEKDIVSVGFNKHSSTVTVSMMYSYREVSVGEAVETPSDVSGAALPGRYADIYVGVIAHYTWDYDEAMDSSTLGLIKNH